MVNDHWVFHLPHLAIVVIAVLCGVMVAVKSYFWLHGDLQMTRTQQWERIWGLISFFVLGICIGGFVSFLFFRMVGLLL